MRRLPRRDQRLPVERKAEQSQLIVDDGPFPDRQRLWGCDPKTQLGRSDPLEIVCVGEERKDLVGRAREVELLMVRGHEAEAACREVAVAVQAARFGIGEVPRPSYWTGFRIVPLSMEFWIDKPFRLHDRLVFKRSSIEMPWASSRMYP